MGKKILAVVVVLVLVVPSSAVWAAPAEMERGEPMGWWASAWSRVMEAVSWGAGSDRAAAPESAVGQDGEVEGDGEGSPAIDPNG